jgi:sRNA-binding carbon storage regulator CsrA
MPRLIKPDPGECVDRQTIVVLKAKYGQSLDEQKVTDKVKTDNEKQQIVATKFTGASKINIQPFIDENESLQQYLEEFYFPLLLTSPDKQNQFDKLYDELLELNGDIWKLEDQVRIYLEAPTGVEAAADLRLLEVYKTITRSNNKRSVLVKQINAIWGINFQEKLH